MSMSRALLCILILWLPNAAWAAPAPIRQNVLAAAMRCSVIANSHQWLDCVYGSAQEMRQSLKLPPAPNAQMQLAQNPPTGGAVYDADVRVSVLSAAVACGGLENDRKWLDCYYGATNGMRARLGLAAFGGVNPAPPPQPGVAAVVASGAVATAPDWRPRPANYGMPFPLTSQVKSFSVNQQGMFTIVLANGQTWRQLSGDTNYAGHVKPDDTISISRGAFGSYNLRIGKHPEYYKVSRAA